MAALLDFAKPTLRSGLSAFGQARGPHAQQAGPSHHHRVAGRSRAAALTPRDPSGTGRASSAAETAEVGDKDTRPQARNGAPGSPATRRARTGRRQPERD